MKRILLIIIVLLAGYLLGSFLPITGFSFFPQKGIQGNAELQIKLTTPDNKSLANVEVDVAEKPGAPPKDGVAITNESGVATLKVKSGTYFIFFNSNTFPANFEIPATKQVIVEEGKINQTSISVKAK